MTIKYRELMKEYKVLIDNPVLAPDFVSKAKDFEEKLAANQLTDDEIKAADDELCELFKTKHDFVDEDSDEIKAAKRGQVLSEARADIAEAGTADELKTLQIRFKDLPEVQPLITKKLQKLDDDAKKADEKKRAEDQAKFLVDAEKEIKAAKYEDLQALGEKYKDHPELVTLINKRHADEKPGKGEAELKEKLLSKREWTYAELEALGIKPTGNDMKVAGLRLEKEYLFRTYSVRR